MDIQQQNHGAVSVIKPLGPVVQDDAEALRGRLLDAQTRSLGRIVLDASAMSFIDSRGLEVLVDVTEALSRSGNALKLCGLNEIVREVLELTDLSSSFELFDDVNSAVRSFM